MFEKKDRIMPKIDEFSAEKKATLADYQAKMAEIEATDPVFGKPEPAHQEAEEDQMKIQISAQHMTGNDPEGFDCTSWLEALEAEYRTLALQEFPQAEVEVSIDVQRASGYCRPVAVCVDDADGVDTSHLEFLVDRAANDLWEKRSQEFFEEDTDPVLQRPDLLDLSDETGGLVGKVQKGLKPSPEFEAFFREFCPPMGGEDSDLLSSLDLGPGEETTEAMLEGFRADIRSRCPRCGLPIHPEREAEAGLCPGCGARHE